MASTNKTPNIQLNQWVASDPVLMSDFNADNSKLDTVIGSIQAGLEEAGNCRIVTGSYLGTGTTGSANPTTLSFDFNPKIVIIGRNEDYSFALFLVSVLKSTGYGWYSVQNSLDTDNNGHANFNPSAHRLSWWYSNNINFPKYQFNNSGVTYHWIAIG